MTQCTHLIGKAQRTYMPPIGCKCYNTAYLILYSQQKLSNNDHLTTLIS